MDFACQRHCAHTSSFMSWQLSCEVLVVLKRSSSPVCPRASCFGSSNWSSLTQKVWCSPSHIRIARKMKTPTKPSAHQVQRRHPRVQRRKDGALGRPTAQSTCIGGGDGRRHPWRSSSFCYAIWARSNSTQWKIPWPNRCCSMSLLPGVELGGLLFLYSNAHLRCV